MIYEIEKELWFDAEKIYIIGGKEHLHNYRANRESYPPPNDPEIAGRFPGIVFLSSTACNLRCSYCYAGQGSYNSISQSSFFKYEDYLKVYHQIVSEYGGVANIGFFGGEPLLNFKAIESFVEYLYEHTEQSLRPTLGINSNGTIMNDEIAEFIIKYGIAFGTSLDGPKQHNDLCRFGDNIESVYDTVIENINRLGNQGVTVAIQFTFNRTHLENYQPGEVIKWVSAFEALPIAVYDIISATTDKPALKIDLSDARIKKNFTLMCEELADHCLNALITGETFIMPKAFTFIFLSIANRKIAKTCAAGDDITVSPDLRVYPCHINASSCEHSEVCAEGLRERIAENEDFDFMRRTTRAQVGACRQCIAGSLCAVFCKGLCGEDLIPPPERCYMMEIFLRRVISFMADKYPLYKKQIRDSMLKINHNIQFRNQVPNNAR